jgi:TonB family protein
LGAAGLVLLAAVAVLVLRGRSAPEALPAQPVPRPTPAPVELVESIAPAPVEIADQPVQPPPAEPERVAPPPEPVEPEQTAPEPVAPEPIAPPAEPTFEPSPPEVAPEMDRPPEPEPKSPEPVQRAPRRIQPGDLIELREVDVKPRPIARALPQYSKLARKKKHQGSIELTLLVDHKGAVQHVELVRGIDGSDLNESAIAAARNWRFLPARSAGVPVQVWIPVVFDFSIERGQTLVRLQR